jgi:DNA-binding XRE family transcriptional regulator
MTHHIDLESYILGENFKQQRELQVLGRAFLAQKLCCSELQIQQIEEGGQSAFYTEAQKLKLANKLASLLRMSKEQAFLGIVPEIKSNFNFIAFPENKPNPSQRFSLGGLAGLGLIVSVILGLGIYEFGSPDVNLYVKNYQSNESIAKTTQSPEQVTTSATVIEEKIAPESPQGPCDLVAQNTSSFVPTTANFAGNFVVFVSKTSQSVCLVDGKGNKQQVDIIPGQNKVVSGIGPFIILGSKLHEIEAYYQGWRVTNISPDTQSVALKELPVQIRSEPPKALVVSQGTNVNEPESSSNSNANIVLPVSKNIQGGENTPASIVSDSRMSTVVNKVNDE